MSIDPQLAPNSASSKAPRPNSQTRIGFWSQIKEDWVAHGQDWTKPGFRAVAVQRFGVWRMQIQPKALRAPVSLLYRSLYRHVRNVYGIDLPYTVQLGRRVIIEHQSGIIIHGGSVIGDDCILRQGVTLGNRYLERPLEAPRLGHRVNVGAGAKILGSVQIGDDANVGANAVVLKDIPPGQTAVGIPARVLGLEGSHPSRPYPFVPNGPIPNGSVPNASDGRASDTRASDARASESSPSKISAEGVS